MDDEPTLVGSSPPASGSGWWIHHVSLAVALWVGLPVFGAAYVLLPDSSVFRGLALVGIASLGFAVFVTAWGALFGYYYDARALRRSGAPWVPAWGWWTVSHVLFWPVVAPLYALTRYRRVGMALPVVGSRRVR